MKNKMMKVVDTVATVMYSVIMLPVLIILVMLAVYAYLSHEKIYFDDHVADIRSILRGIPICQRKSREADETIAKQEGE